MRPIPADWPAPSDIPGLDWLRTPDKRVVCTLRRRGIDAALAEPLTVTGCAPLVRVLDETHMAWWCLSECPQFFMPGLCPADAITRNILRAEARASAARAHAIRLACEGRLALRAAHTAFLDEPFEADSSTPCCTRLSR